MKSNTIVSRIAAALLSVMAAVTTAAVQAQELTEASELTQPTAEARRQTFVPQHEVRFSVGYYPLPSAVEYKDYYRYSNTWDNYYDFSDPKRYLYRKGDRTISGAWTAAYDYRLKKWIDFGVSLTYYGEYSSLYSNLDNSFVRHLRFHSISVMPMMRFTFLNRSLVRLYTTLGAGMHFDFGTRNEGGRLLRFAGQFSMGIAVGKSLFGFAEAGFGAHGSLVAGIGYRFNDKK